MKSPKNNSAFFKEPPEIKNSSAQQEEKNNAPLNSLESKTLPNDSVPLDTRGSLDLSNPEDLPLHLQRELRSQLKL